MPTYSEEMFEQMMGTDGSPEVRRITASSFRIGYRSALRDLADFAVIMHDQMDTSFPIDEK